MNPDNRLWYYNTYNRLINKNLSRGLDKTKFPNLYLEKHHIFPKCQGGKDENNNYVLLTAREHIIVHILLAKAFPENYLLAIAAGAMTQLTRNDNMNRDFYLFQQIL